MGERVQAVIVIHGMGEQIPMQTLNSFVDAVWTKDESLLDTGKPDPNTGGRHSQNASWAKPDKANDNYELRRITTEASKDGPRTDFFEFYWAHHVKETTVRQLLSWIKTLLFRNPFRSVPIGVLPVWILLWMVTLITFAATIYPWLNDQEIVAFDTWVHIGVVAFGAAIWYLLSRHLIRSFGDVARYVKAAPYNVHIRQTIREEGVGLLEKILDQKNEDEETYKYDRVIIVAHSLGTIVAYDILTHAFARRNTRFARETAPQTEPVRAALEQALREATQTGELDLGAFRALQDKARSELNRQGLRWTVSDFVTLGSPLTHAEFLLAKDKADLRAEQEKRLFPTCPPTLEYDLTTKQKHFTYRYGGITDHYLATLGGTREARKRAERHAEAPRTPHHAAQFAYTRWTNLYSPHRLILFGDVISGPVGEAFGSLSARGEPLTGIKDIQVMPKGKGFPPFLSHTKYWSLKTKAPKHEVPHHIQELRRALKLGGLET